MLFKRKIEKNSTNILTSDTKLITSGSELKRFKAILKNLSEFSIDVFDSFDKFVRVMYRSTDAASLGVVRALFGLCMVIDVVEERGFANVNSKWGDPDTCHFPLIHGLRSPSLLCIIVIYGIMWLGAFGIMLGYRFKIASVLYAFPYWYLFVLDKSFWNNHSYLFGLVGSLLWTTGANKYFSLDAKFKKPTDASDQHVPYWNYFLLKFQFFIMYFIAGLKKSGEEWLTGYAMLNLSRHWVFEPFKLILTTEQIDFFVVHWFAFVFDLTVGFLMLLEPTRLPSMLFCAVFHFMNSRLFAIGMFPYVCLATMPLFCRNDWPRKLKVGKQPLPPTEPAPRSRVKGFTDCCDFKLECSNSRKYYHINKEKKLRGRKNNSIVVGSTPTKSQKFVVASILAYVALQSFLPYSHFLTKGYNNWVPGLYGYSWDMMVHAWDVSHIVVKITDNENEKSLYLDPESWLINERWARHGDMVRQYAFCIKDNLEKKKTVPRDGNELWSKLSSNISIYIDVWCSLNGRFQQRLFDPRVDLLKADWHPLKPVSYLMPLLQQFTPYREQLGSMRKEAMSWSNDTQILFVADYPNQTLENYLSRELINVTLQVLEGQIILEIVENEEVEEEEKEKGCGQWITMVKGGTATTSLQTGRFHRVHTVGPHPACYVYTFAVKVLDTKQHLASSSLHRQRRRRGPQESRADQLHFWKWLNGKLWTFARAIMGQLIKPFLHLTFNTTDMM